MDASAICKQGGPTGGHADGRVSRFAERAHKENASSDTIEEGGQSTGSMFTIKEEEEADDSRPTTEE